MSQLSQDEVLSVLTLSGSLFIVKDGLVFVEAATVFGGDDVTARKDVSSQLVFADINGDDWFYFEDNTSSSPSSPEQYTKPMVESHISARAISSSLISLISIEYDDTPQHTVLHEGRCNFAGLKPVSLSGQDDPDLE